MGEKIAKLGIKRDNDLMYYIKNGDVWATPRKKPGQPKGKAAKVAAAGIEMDYSKFLYFLDGDGDVARKERQVGGSKRKKTAKAAAPKKAAAAKPAAAKSSAKKGAAKKAAPAKKGAGGKKAAPAKKGKKK
ncbi:MAG TPA: hypothetical protein VK427_11930 [Kofleriaceae bacterium]|nr:hypothetical protein [Kofleriaceae bacterium]